MMFPLQLTHLTLAKIVREILNYSNRNYTSHILNDPDRWAHRG